MFAFVLPPLASASSAKSILCTRLEGTHTHKIPFVSSLLNIFLPMITCAVFQPTLKWNGKLRASKIHSTLHDSCWVSQWEKVSLLQYFLVFRTCSTCRSAFVREMVNFVFLTILCPNEHTAIKRRRFIPTFPTSPDWISFQKWQSIERILVLYFPARSHTRRPNLTAWWCWKGVLRFSVVLW